MMLSESQHKLIALLIKTKAVLPFATDAACDEMFLSLAQFARNMISKNEHRKETNFDSMTLEDLLQLATPGLTVVALVLFLLIAPHSSGQGSREKAARRARGSPDPRGRGEEEEAQGDRQAEHEPPEETT